MSPMDMSSVQEYPWTTQLALQLFWILPLLIGLNLLRESQQWWITSRFKVRGWFSWFLIVMALWMGGLVNGLGTVSWLEAHGAPMWLTAGIAGFLLFVPIPVAVLALLVGWPRRLQPRWIRERLEAGDKVQIPFLPREQWGVSDEPVVVAGPSQETLDRMEAELDALNRATLDEMKARRHAEQAARRRRRRP